MTIIYIISLGAVSGSCGLCWGSGSSRIFFTLNLSLEKR